MKRKVVQHGSSSLTITLPIKWVEKYGLKKGEELDLEENGHTLLISTDTVKRDNKKVYTAQESGVFTKNDLSHLYQLGYDEIEVYFKDNKTINDIKKRIQNCIGYEIIDMKDNKVHIKSLMTTLEAEFDTLLRKSFQTTNEMCKEILQSIKEGNNEKLEETRHIETLNNRFTDLCIRILHKKGYPNQEKQMQIFEVIKNIERIADVLKYLCDTIVNIPRKLKPETIKNIEEAINYYLDFSKMVFKFDPKLKNKICTSNDRLIKKYLSLMSSKSGQETVILHHLIDLIRRTYDCSGAYFAFKI